MCKPQKTGNFVLKNWRIAQRPFLRGEMRQFRAKSKRDLVTPNCPCASPFRADVRQLGPVLAGWVGVGAEEVEGELGGGGAEGAAPGAGLWKRRMQTE